MSMAVRKHVWQWPIVTAVLVATVVLLTEPTLVGDALAFGVPPAIERRLIMTLERLIVVYSGLVGAIFAAYSIVAAGFVAGIGSLLALSHEVARRCSERRWISALAIAGAATCMGIEVILVVTNASFRK